MLLCQDWRKYRHKTTEQYTPLGRTPATPGFSRGKKMGTKLLGIKIGLFFAVEKR